MRRHWRASRILLTVLLLSVAALMFYAWPVGPRWHYLDEHLLGFDLKQGLLLTTYVTDKDANEGTEVHGFDLVTGERKLCMPFLREMTGTREGTSICFWSFLSPDSSRLVCLKPPGFTLHVLDVENQCQRLFSSMVGKEIQTMGFSSNGKLFAYSCSEEVSVVECQTGKIIKRLTMPAETCLPIDHNCQDGTLRFSGDGQLLAVAGLDSIFVFDLVLDRMIGQCPQSSFPVFLADNTTLLALPHDFTEKEYRFAQYSGLPRTTSFENPSWHSLDMEELSRMKAHLITGKYVYGANTTNLVINATDMATDDKKKKLPDWIPEALRKKLETALGWSKERWLFQSWDIQTGQLRAMFKIPMDGCYKAKSSSDGLLLAVEDHQELSLWDIPPRRPMTCWLVCCVVGMLSLLLVWSGRGRVVNVKPI